MARECRACAVDPWGICERHERMAEDRKEARTRATDDAMADGAAANDFYDRGAW